MTIEQLKTIVPPPMRPSEIGTLHQWEAVERQLGLALPSDYRDFVFAYGSGLFARFYCVFNPFSVLKHAALLSSIQTACAAELEIKRNWPDQIPYPIYPEIPGLLPWGCDENGNLYFWLTKGDPDTWQILSDEVRGNGFQEYGCTMTEFLTGILLGKFKALAGDYLQEEDRIFKSWTT